MTEGIKIVVDSVASTAKPKTSKRRIKQGRARKQELRYGKLSYKARKKLNLMDLVQEYEIKRDEHMAHYWGSRIFNLIMLYHLAIAKTIKHSIDRQMVLDEISIDMIFHYDNVLNKMIVNYKDFLGFPKISFDENNKEKQDNLQQLVQEYESGRRIIETRRKDILDSLTIEGMIKSYDACQEQAFAEYEINIDMLNHYRNVEKQLIEHYKNVDVMKRAILRSSDIYNKSEPRNARGIYISVYDIGENPTPYQLRLIVNSFNNNQRHS